MCVSPDTYNAAYTACDNGNFAPCSGYVVSQPCSHDCNRLVTEAQNELGPLVDPYDVIGDVCLTGQSRRETQAYRIAMQNPVFSGGLDVAGKPLRANVWPPCVDDYSSNYLNLASVKQAIHANPAITWVDCSNSLNYNFSHDSMLPLYASFFDNTNLDVLIYSGDQDSILPFIGTQANIAAMNRTIKQGWRQWVGSDGQNAGFFTIYDRLTFLTIKGAGHLVPGTQPQHALDWFSRWIAGTPFGAATTQA